MPNLWDRALVLAHLPPEVQYSAVLIILIGLLVISNVLRFLGEIVAGFTKFAEAIQIVPNWLILSREQKHAIRSRETFCSSMIADFFKMGQRENWYDQSFTDLEAEVETQGAYFSSPSHFGYRRRQHGLRRVKSLLEAMRSSSEQNVLLVGDPGSGKSIAMRHLGLEIALRARKSKRKNVTIPLYLNLRELRTAPGTMIDADFIKQFVFERIRNGDADSSRFLQANWDEFKDDGRWLFLFDSFDEIPEVLHAETGGRAIEQYADALRQFLSGMGRCRGIVASREFKGPQALPWARFRIQLLSEARQVRLIKNSVLTEDQIARVRKYLATTASALKANPMFLSLLCQYVHEEDAVPPTDYDLIARQIEHLARREPAHLLKHYGLTPDELVDGAEILSAIIADDPELSLAPTIEELEVALSFRQSAAFDILNLTSALVDVKIGRSDVRDASPGERRFAFSHRRYHEALFVKYLAKHPTHISKLELLNDLRWREYTVTLLQTQSVDVVEPFLTLAASELEMRSREQERTIASADLELKVGFELRRGYFDWEEEPAAYLISVLQEGLARRPEIVPDSLVRAVAAVLQPRWDLGDTYDRRKVIEHGSLLHPKTLMLYLTYAFESGTPGMEEDAFRQLAFLREDPLEVAHRIRGRLAAELLAAQTESRVLQLEALAARAPDAINTGIVVRRCLLLRSLLPPAWLTSWLRVFAFGDARREGTRDYLSFSLMLVVVGVCGVISVLVSIVPSLLVTSATSQIPMMRNVGVIISVVTIVYAALTGFLFATQSLGRVTIRSFLQELVKLGWPRFRRHGVYAA